MLNDYYDDRTVPETYGPIQLFPENFTYYIMIKHLIYWLHII